MKTLKKGDIKIKKEKKKKEKKRKEIQKHTGRNTLHINSSQGFCYLKID